ncbi:MAG: hypothetical protein M3388_12960 [Acidobacteriota bacterium]|nr:hypothetical protein [Acidobacteriota bacterium]
MNELLVEWTLLREKSYLEKCLNLPLKRKLFQQYSTEYGRIDFAHELKDGSVAITELETSIDNKSKLEYCQTQTLEYQKIKFQNAPHPIIVILAAQETPARFQKELIEFTRENDFLLRFYSLALVSDYYKQLVDEAVKNSGIPIVNPVANNFTHLSCLGRFILPFYEKNTFDLRREDFVEYFSLRNDRADSHFKVHKQMAEYFELTEDVSETQRFSKVKLTEYGVRFRDNLNYDFVLKKGLTKANVKRIELSLEQKRILLESLMNGNIGARKGKANILYFLRFVHLTEGVWIPRGRTIDNQKMNFANSFLGTNYTQITLSNWLNFVCTHCEELGLVERIRTTTEYDRVTLSSFGSRVLGFIEMDLHLKREKIQIPLQL